MRISDWSSDVCSSDLEVFANRRPAREPVEIHLEIFVDRMSGGRRAAGRRILTIHGVGETAAQPVLHRVDLFVLRTVFRIYDVGGPHRRRMRFPAPVEMTAGA